MVNNHLVILLLFISIAIHLSRRVLLYLSFRNRGLCNIDCLFLLANPKIISIGGGWIVRGRVSLTVGLSFCSFLPGFLGFSRIRCLWIFMVLWTSSWLLIISQTWKCEQFYSHPLENTPKLEYWAHTETNYICPTMI